MNQPGKKVIEDVVPIQIVTYSNVAVSSSNEFIYIYIHIITPHWLSYVSWLTSPFFLGNRLPIHCQSVDPEQSRPCHCCQCTLPWRCWNQSPSGSYGGFLKMDPPSHHIKLRYLIYYIWYLDIFGWFGGTNNYLETSIWGPIGEYCGFGILGLWFHKQRIITKQWSW